MRILVVQESDWIDRNPVLHHRMLEDLSRQGHDVTVIDCEILWHQKGRRPLIARRREVRDCRKFFQDSAVTVVRPSMVRLPVLSRPTWLAANFRELRHQIRDHRPDVVVGYSISNSYFAVRLAHAAGIPFVYHVMDALHTLGEPAFLRSVAKPVERAIMRRADQVIVVNNGLRDYVVAMGAPAARIHVIPMGVDRVRSADVPDMRPSLGLGPDDVVLMFMGWLYRFSGLMEVTERLARRTDLPHYKLLVVGNGDLLEVLSRRRDELGLGERLILTGRRPASEMPAYLAAADVCLLPAQRNATMEHIVPAKVIEYMQAGKPVAATSLPGIQKEFGELPGIIYLEEGGEAIDRIAGVLGADDPRAEARRLGVTCRSFTEARPSWEHVTNQFVDVLFSVTADRLSRSRSSRGAGTASAR
jgi:glycosyltransferase involved in cell wall biosynthesis